MRAHRRPRVKHSPAGRVGVPDQPRQAHEENRVRQLVEDEIDRRKLGRRPLLGEPKSKRGPEMAGETLGPLQIGSFKVAARFVAERHNDRRGVDLEQGRGRHHAVKALRREPVG